MKVRITKEGNLEFERNGKFKLQTCPYHIWDTKQYGYNEGYEHLYRPCGDWCPLFELKSIHSNILEPENDRILLYELQLCKRTISIRAEDLEDLRG